MTTKKKKKAATKKSAKKTGGSKYNPKPIPAGLQGDPKKAHLIINDWAQFLFTFNKDVFAELHNLVDDITALEKRIAKLDSTNVQPTVVVDHISDPPPPPFT